MRALPPPWEQSTWTRAAPPEQPVTLETNSFVYVPLLLQAAGKLDAGAERGWSTHTLSRSWWGEAVQALQRAPACSVNGLLRSASYILPPPARATEHPDIATVLPRWLMAAGGPDRPVLDVAASVNAALGSDAYVPPAVQDLLLFHYAGGALASRIATAANAFRRPPGVSPLPATDAAHHRLLPQPLRPRLLGRQCFRRDADAEVGWWCAQLLQAPERERAQLWARLPSYTQYIQEASLDEVLTDTIDSLRALKGQSLTADAACELAPRLGAVTTLPLAVLCMYSAICSAKPEYFVFDLVLTYLASLLHEELVVIPFPEDESTRICPRYWATPTGGTTAGKSPSYNFVTCQFLATMKQCDTWEFRHFQDGNIYADGSHGGFNEKVRQYRARVCITSPEATNQLNSQYP